MLLVRVSPEPSLKAWRGLTDEDELRFARLRQRLAGSEVGECVGLEYRHPRNAKFHRKFFALLKLGFDAWEPGRKRKTYRGKPVSKSFDAFREEVTILAGFYEQAFDLDGRMLLRAKSIKFGSMDDVEFGQLYEAVLDVLLKHVLTNYKDRDEVDRVVEQLMEFA